MNIGQYYKRNGRNTPVANLVAAKEKIKSEFTIQQKTSAFTDYLNLLNAISYPDKHGNIYKDITQAQMDGMNDALKVRFNVITELSKHITNIPLTDNIDLGDASTYVNKGAQEAIDKFERSVRGKKATSKTGAMWVSTYLRLIDQFKEIQEKIIKGAESGDYVKGSFDGAADLSEFENMLKAYIEENPISDAEGLARNSYYFKPSQIKNDETIRNIAKNLIYWTSYFSYNPNTTNQIGDVAEAMSELVKDIYNEGVDAALKKGEKAVFEQLSTTSTGGSRTGTNGKVTVSIDMNDIKQLVDEKNISSAAKTFTFDGYTYQIDFSYNADTNRQIKADVTVSDDMKLSVKNWGQMTIMLKDAQGNMNNYYRSLGGTYITNAIQRSCGAGVLEDYIYVIQDNQLKDTAEGAIAVSEAHDLARLSLLADIATGYSQKNFGGNANYLIINNRSKREWIGIDLYRTILNSMEGKRTDGSSGSYLLELQGYHNKEISDVAWSIMKRVLKNKRGDEQSAQQLSQASSMYKAMVLQRLHQKMISAALNNGDLKNA